MPIFIHQRTLIALRVQYLRGLADHILYLRYIIYAVLNLSNILRHLRLAIYITSLIVHDKTAILTLNSSPHVLVSEINIRNDTF